MPFTPSAQLDLLFDTSLVPKTAYTALQEKKLELRPLSSSDYARGHLDVLADLTETPDIGAQAWQERFNLMKSSKNVYYILVIIDKDTDKMVATGSLIIEYKFLRNAGNVGHIEDIAVSKKAQGKRLGYHMVTALTELSASVGCYKCILDCSEENRGFYEKCGHIYKGIQMANYVSSAAKKAE